MADSRRENFVKRLSSVGLGTRESVQVMIGDIVCEIREQAVHKKFTEDDMETVVAFHDAAESLWQDSIVTNPPIDPAKLTSQLHDLRQSATGVLGQYEAKLQRGIDHAEQLNSG